ncbi:serine hydrolase domain-containing protein [Sphingomonas sp. MMS12-HWE2-04]|uniref:serine hydrolase domain-containing protein n=1 Tax=Sphingomonas sp. MMS12-HWE2-04 TaxID=3234199 RepID=UPI00384C7A17
MSTLQHNLGRLNAKRALALALALALFAIAIWAGSANATARSPASALPQLLLNNLADRYLQDKCRVGVSLVARVGSRTFFANRGWTSRARATRPTIDSVYELASVTKTFVGVMAAMALIDRRMTLDRDFRAYLPNAYPNLQRAGTPITLRSLAAHSSGLPRDLPDSGAILADPDYDTLASQFAALNKGHTREKDLAALRLVQLRDVPGAAFAYSNLDMRVIGYGLETVYDTPFRRLLGTRLLHGLDMGSTDFVVGAAMRNRLVTPYNRNGRAQPFHDDSAGAAYGLYSTPRDMARYLAWHLSGSALASRSHALIRGNAQNGQSLIWNATMRGGETMLWHGGGSFGSTSQMVLFPSAKMGLVLLANNSCEGSEDALKQMASDLFDATRP